MESSLPTDQQKTAATDIGYPLAATHLSVRLEGGLRLQGQIKSASLDKPLVSIITVVYNGEKFIEQTIRSVVEQAYANIEYIIIDGGSNDGTINIIQQYATSIDYWRSEPDQGISDAFNKGILLASGDLVGLINADDWYEPSAIAEVVEEFNRSRSGVIYGNMQCWKGQQKDYLFKANYRFLYQEMSLNHPATFVRRDVYTQYGGYDTSYQLAMDYELLLRFLGQGVAFSYMDQVLANLRWDGLSDQRFAEGYREVKRAKDAQLGKSINHQLYYWRQLAFTVLPRFLDKVGLSFVVKFYRQWLSPVKKEQD